MKRVLVLLPSALLLFSLCWSAGAVQEGIMEANGSTGLVTDFDREGKKIFIDGAKFYISGFTEVAREDGTPMSMLLVKTGMVMRFFVDRKSVTPGADAATLERLVFIRMEED